MMTSDNTVGSFLTNATSILAESGIMTARLDVLILLEDILGQNRANILAHPEQNVTTSQKETLDVLITKRQSRTPLAYLRGKTMFYGRIFLVTTDTLVPRPESEDMITILKTCLSSSQSPSIADIGTGTGCLGLTAMLELPSSTSDLYDMSDKALVVAKKNAKLLGVSPTHYFEEDLLSNANERVYDALLANLPYVPDEYEINPDAAFEPRIALFAGKDGLDDYRIFWDQISHFESKPKFILTESIPDIQHRKLRDLAKQTGYELKQTSGFIQLFAAT